MTHGLNGGEELAVSVDIDRELCIGSGTCVRISAGAIELDDEGVATVLDPAVATSEQLDQAARSCPTAAITVETSET